MKANTKADQNENFHAQLLAAEARIAALEFNASIAACEAREANELATVLVEVIDSTASLNLLRFDTIQKTLATFTKSN